MMLSVSSISSLLFHEDKEQFMKGMKQDGHYIEGITIEGIT